MQYPLPVLPLSRARCRGFRRTFALSCRRRTAAASVAFVDAVVALPFAADACWSPHLLKQTQMMPMTPPNWRRCGSRF